MPFSTPFAVDHDSARDISPVMSMTPGWTYDSRSIAGTHRLGEAIGRGLHGGEIFALYGDLGSGKTAFVTGLATGLAVPARDVSSPTFVLIHEYRGRLLLIHADLYRIEQPPAVNDLGLDEYFDGHAVVALEWADKAAGLLPADRLDIQFSHAGKTRRHLAFQATGPRSEAALGRIIQSARDRRPRKDSHAR